MHDSVSFKVDGHSSNKMTKCVRQKRHLGLRTLPTQRTNFESFNADIGCGARLKLAIVVFTITENCQNHSCEELRLQVREIVVGRIAGTFHVVSNDDLYHRCVGRRRAESNPI